MRAIHRDSCSLKAPGKFIRKEDVAHLRDGGAGVCVDVDCDDLCCGISVARVSDLTVRDISSQFVLGWLWGSLCSGDFIPIHLAP